MSTRPTDNDALHVAVGVIRNSQGEVLIAKRHEHLHQGGLWEFPGGKVEMGESVYQALVRELHEELGIELLHAEPLIQVRHSYSDRSVLLDTWEVVEFAGTPVGREAQPVRWVPTERLPQFAFPAANRPIVTAARLPDRYAILNDPDPAPVWLEATLSGMYAAGIRLLQLRAKTLSPSAYRSVAAAVVDQCHSLGLAVLLNAEPQLAMELGADGVHLDSARLNALEARPLEEGMWVAASCHNVLELDKAAAMGADFVVLSPVLPTPSHTSAVPLGWASFRDLTARVNLPVYALGGMNLDCMDRARQNGGRGIAGIRGVAGSC